MKFQCQFLSNYLEDLSDVEECSDSNDVDFEIHEDSVHMGFDQH